MHDLTTLFLGKKKQPRYLKIDWQIELGVRDNSEWIPVYKFAERYNYQIPISTVDVCVRFNQENIQQISIDQVQKFAGSCQVDEVTILADCHVFCHALEISVVGLDQILIPEWSNENIELAVKIVELNVQGISITNVFSEQMIIAQDSCEQFKIDSPVYPWLLDHHERILQNMQ